VALKKETMSLGSAKKKQQNAWIPEGLKVDTSCKSRLERQPDVWGGHLGWSKGFVYKRLVLGGERGAEGQRA